MTDESTDDPAKQRVEPRFLWGRRLVVCYLALIAAGVLVIAVGHLNPKDPNRNAATASCVRLLPDDDLVHLPLRTTERDARAQLDRWSACDASRVGKDHSSALSDARSALRWDYALMAILTLAFGLASYDLFSGRARWRLSSYFAIALTIAYALTDFAENKLISKFLDDEVNGYSRMLPWVSSVKFGTAVGCFAFFSTAFLLTLWEAVSRDEPVRKRLPGYERPSPVEFCMRSVRRFVKPNVLRGAASKELLEIPEKVKPAVCCSGGGVRSAAFNLGALQALDVAPTTNGSTELRDAETISAVSGGSYMAAAWVTARTEARAEALARHAPDPALDADPAQRPWGRGSREEDHLRRHSSYLAPGLAGKLWAITRYLAGFAVNIGLVALALAAVGLPYGWGVDHFQRTKDFASGSTVALPRGACVELGDGRVFLVLPGVKLTLGSSRAAVDNLGTQSPATTSGAVDDRCPPVDKPSTVAKSARSGVPRGSWYEEGTKLALAISNASTPSVSGSNIEGCVINPPATTELTSCSPTSEAVVATRLAHARLVLAPEATVTLARAAVVDERGLAAACGRHACEEFSPWSWMTKLVFLLVGVAALLGLSGAFVRATAQNSDRTETVTRALVNAAIIAVLVVVLAPRLVTWVENGRWLFNDPWSRGIGSSSVVIALLAQIAGFSGSGSTPATGVSKLAAPIKTFGARLRPIFVRIVGAVVGPAIIASAFIGFASVGSQDGATPGQIGLLTAVLGLFALVLSGGDLNEWSMHPFYRRQLQTAFAITVTPPPAKSSHRPTPREDPLIGLPVAGATSPALVICAAANLADDRITAPGRPVTSWTFDREQFGSRALAVLTPGEEKASLATLPARWRDLGSTWTAVAMSGAAFSPAMGKMTKPERMLFALGNLRLGVWYPNPIDLNRRADYYERHHPRPWYLVKEALGLHKPDDKWIYVTDGGHYENLGLVELLRCGYREIYCFDASGDTTDTFGTLADAVRLAREDGIELDFNPEHLKANKDGISELGVWAGTIRYRGDVKATGWFVVAKLEVPKAAPFDIIDLARTLPSFPNHSTADQLYTDQKFEAYRALGHYLGERAAHLGAKIRVELSDEHKDVADAVAAANEAQISGP